MAETISGRAWCQQQEGIQKHRNGVFQCYVKDSKGENTKDMMLKLSLETLRLFKKNTMKYLSFLIHTDHQPK